LEPTDPLGLSQVDVPYGTYKLTVTHSTHKTTVTMSVSPTAVTSGGTTQSPFVPVAVSVT
jgi:hypothetical protein